MSSFLRRMQRSAPHTIIVWNAKAGEFRRLERAGRPFPYMGRGSKLGITNPACRCKLAREKREAKRAASNAKPL